MTEEQKPVAAGSVSSGVREALREAIASVNRKIAIEERDASRCDERAAVGDQMSSEWSRYAKSHRNRAAEHHRTVVALQALTREEAPREDAGDVARLREAVRSIITKHVVLGGYPDTMGLAEEAYALGRAHALAPSPAGTDEGSAS